MNNLGGIIKKLREEKGLPLRTVAAFLDIDQAILSKIERGKRKPARDHVIKLAKYFKVKENVLLVAWLSDKLIYDVADEQVALQALQVAEEKTSYNISKKINRKTLMTKIRDFFAKDKRINKAWLFGSFVRGEDDYRSDIDVILRFNEKLKLSLFDLSDIEYKLEHITERKMDIAEEGTLEPFAWNTAKNELLLIYER